MAHIRAVLDHVAVREAERYLIDSSKKPTYSNISIITGLERRHVASLLATWDDHGPPPAVSAMHRAVRVLNGWHEDPLWTTRAGKPATLVVRGTGRTFEGLAIKYAGGVSPGAILQRLIETNTVEVVRRDDSGRPDRVRPLQATIEPDVSATEVFDEFGAVYSEALEMFDGNLRASSDHERMAPYTVTATVPASKLRELRRQIVKCTQAAQATIRPVLEQHDLSPSEVSEIIESDPSTLRTIRLTIISTIRPTVPIEPIVQRAWRRDAKRKGQGD